MKLNTLNTIGAIGATCISMPLLAATDIGTRSYNGYANGPNLPEQTISLPAYEGNNTVYYHNNDQVSLSRTEIDTLVNYLDGAMALYRDYGNLTSYPHPNFGGLTEHANKGSVVLREGPDGGFAAGLGLNGKSEVFKFWFNADAFNDFPVDIRTWDTAYYELGRGTPFSIYDYFRFTSASQDIESAFPRFITFSIMNDLGIDHELSALDPFWGDKLGTNPVLMNNKLQPLLETNNYIDFYSRIDDPDNPGQTFVPGAISRDLNNDGDTEDTNESIGINDAQAVILYDLRDTYGHDFMVEFFNYATNHADTKKPENSLDAICNIVDAGNEALFITQHVPHSINAVGLYLTQNFKFPTCSSESTLFESFESGISWENTGAFPWATHTGKTPSLNTGPNGASIGSNYLYLETSSNNAFTSGDTALLESPVFEINFPELSFDHHMFGSDMGALAVDIYTDENWVEIWAVSGQRNTSETDAWHSTALSLDDYSGHLKIRFRGIANGGYRGDIAIDNILITSVERPKIRHTSFDGDWVYLEWEIVSDATEYTQFVIGNNQNGQKFLFNMNSGATNRGNYVYSYYHRNDICNAFGTGTFSLTAQIWPDSDSNRAVHTTNFGSITCP